MRRGPVIMAALSAILLGPAAACGGSPGAEPADVQQGDVARGPMLIARYGCSSCHTVPGVPGANGRVGPPLTAFGGRSYIAGRLPNNGPNLRRWIRDPQGVEPGNAMPDLGVTEADARDIAAYLLTLR